MSRVLPTKRLLGLGVMAAGAVVTEGLCGGVGKAVAGLLGGVCGNLFAGFLQPALGDDEPSPETLIKNHDLRLLVGLAIRDTILLSADQVPDRRALDTLADAARELWASEATAADTSYQPLDEEAVTQMFAGGDLGFAEMRALDEATWRTFIDTAASALGDDSNLEGPLRQAIAVRLHRDLPEMLRAKVKQDFDGGTAAEGRGYASLQLVMMGRILAAVEKVSERSAADLAGDGELIDQLRKLNDRLPERVEFHKTRLGGRERNILARTLDQINTLRPHLDKRLDEVLRALAAEGAASRSRDTKTHEQLVRILAVVAVLALVGVVGWMTLYRGQTEQRRQVGETDVKIREIADHLIAQSTRLEVENEDLKAELRAENEKLRGELEAALARVNKARQAGDPDAPDISRDPGQPMTLAYLLKDRQRVAAEQGRVTQELVERDHEIAGLAIVTGRLDEASAALQRVLAVRPDARYALVRLGLVYKLQGDLEAAEATYKRVVELSTDDPGSRALAYSGLGMTYRSGEDLVRAEQMYLKALEIKEELGWHEHMALDYGALGRIYEKRDDLVRAEGMYIKALELDEKFGLLEDLAVDYAALASVYDERDDPEKAEEMYLKSLAVDEKLGRLEDMDTTYFFLGGIYEKRNDLKKTDWSYRMRVEIQGKLGRFDGVAEVFGEWGLMYDTRDDLAKARQFYNASLQMYRRAGDSNGVEKMEGMLRSIEPPAPD